MSIHRNTLKKSSGLISQSKHITRSRKYAMAISPTNNKGQASMIQAAKYHRLIPRYLALFTNCHQILHPYILLHHLSNIAQFYKFTSKGEMLVRLLVQPMVQSCTVKMNRRHFEIEMQKVRSKTFF